MSLNPPQHLTIIDPRTADGTPFEVVDLAVAQLAGLVEVLLEQIEPAKLMASSAFMEAQARSGQEIDADKWLKSPQYRNWEKNTLELRGILARYQALQKALAYDPKNPYRAPAKV